MCLSEEENYLEMEGAGGRRASTLSVKRPSRSDRRGSREVDLRKAEERVGLTYNHI